MRKMLLVLLLCLLPICARADLVAHFVDVGHGDCTILISNGEAAIIDGGPVGASDTVFTYLRDLGITDIKYVFATHPQTDHVGGLPAAFFACDVGSLYTPVTESDNARFNVLLDTASEQSVPIIVPSVGDQLPLGDATITILSPAHYYSDPNDMSLVLLVSSPEMTVLLCGDAGEKVERDLLASDFDLTADVLRVGHHGSRTASSEAFVVAVSPRFAVVSSSDRYSNPDPDVTSILIEHNATVLCTDNIGTFAIGGNMIIGAKSQQETIYPYVGNRKSHVLHYGSCESVKNMKESNKVIFETFEEATEKGYRPCKSCHPQPKEGTQP